MQVIPPERSQGKDTLGAPRPQAPRQGISSLASRQAILLRLKKNNNFRLQRWERTHEGFRPKKAGKGPGGKRAFPRGLSCFHRMRSIRAGGFAAGPEASLVPLSFSGNQFVSSRQVPSASAGPGRSPPWWGAGQSPARPPFFFMIPQGSRPEQCPLPRRRTLR